LARDAGAAVVTPEHVRAAISRSDRAPAPPTRAARRTARPHARNAGAPARAPAAVTNARPSTAKPAPQPAMPPIDAVETAPVDAPGSESAAAAPVATPAPVTNATDPPDSGDASRD